MVQLIGDNLGKRQHELNLQVSEAAKKNVNFDKIKHEKENSDVDKLFKIDLASKYKNIDYIVETLKCGDSLYISRCLKIDWLYDDDHSNIINPEYLDKEILPLMSTKMQWKTLKTIATHMKNKRAEDFYEFCVNLNLPLIADKFLPMTSEYFKLEQLNKNYDNFSCEVKDFIGDSLILAKAYLKCKNHDGKVLYQLRYLYSLSDTAYLDLLEEYGNVDMHGKLGIRSTKDIVTKHKQRILKNPILYLKVLNLKVLCKHLSSSDAKIFLNALLPNTVKKFWSSNFLKNHKDLFNLIPFEERLKFLKVIFANKYKTEMSEFSAEFYSNKFYTLMTIEEKEVWALKHLESEQCILGKEKEYVWYEYVDFKKAFAEIKKIIMRTSDPYERLDILKVLTNPERSQRDLETVFNYYYDRHVNEKDVLKDKFLLNSIDTHDFLSFDDSCWNAFNKILYSLKVYDINHPYCDELKVTVLYYYIINNKELPDALKYYLDHRLSSFFFTTIMNRLRMTQEKKEYAYNFIMEYFESKIKKFDDQSYDDEIKSKARHWIEYILYIMRAFKKKADECPEIVIKYMKLDLEGFGHHEFIKKVTPELTQSRLLSLLKKDSKLIISDNVLKDGLGDIKLGTFYKKLKTYFADDIAKEYEQYFIKFLSKKGLKSGELFTVMFGIFELGSDDFKNRIMLDYVPSAPKIDHTKVDRDLLKIQESICRFAHYSRPPVPLSNMLMYLKGDYVQFCLPMFGAYFTNLPKSQCIKFIEATLDAPISIQKHGIRLAFKCFDRGSLKTVLLRVWKNTKNTTLRAILYEKLFHKVSNEEKDRDVLFDVLKTFTMDLTEKDEEKLFNLINIYHLPDDFTNDLIQAAWGVVSKFPDKISNCSYKNRVLNSMIKRINCVDDEFLKPIVESHVQTLLVEKHIKFKYEKNELKCLMETQWDLVKNYIIKYKNKEEMESKLTLLKLILTNCLEMWNFVHSDDDMDENAQETYTIREFCLNFIEDINEKCVHVSNNEKMSLTPVIETILIWLENSLRIEEIFFIFLQLKISLICKAICESEKYKDAKKYIFEFAKELIVALGSEFGKFLKELVDKFKSIPYFMTEIEDLIYSYATSVVYAVFPDNNVDTSTLKLFLCVGLTNVHAIESYYIALNLLCLEAPVENKKDYENVLHQLKMFKDNTIQCCLYQKFNKDFKRRRYF